MGLSSVSNEPTMLRPSGPDDLLASRVAAHQLTSDDWTSRGIVGFNSRDRRSRAFNLLRSQIMKAATGRRLRIIGVTSPTPRVGKTFVATNLAASLSRIPTLSTHLFDLDLRRGSVAEMFGTESGTGIESFLSGEVDTLAEVRYEVTGTRLSVFPSFVTDRSSAELLASHRMRSLIESMQALPEDTVCLCDLPPVFANDDASIIIGQIDAYVLVVEEGKTTARQVRDSLDVLSPAPCLGTILNRYKGGIGGDDYGFGYGRQSGYDAYYA